MSIPGAKYRYGSVKIPASQYEAIEDFARVEGFKISTRAQKIMDRFKKSITVEVKERTSEDDKKSLRDILLESGAIDGVPPCQYLFQNYFSQSSGLIRFLFCQPSPNFINCHSFSATYLSAFSSWTRYRA